MCVGENCAPQATHYINAQLSALYDNAVGCVERHSKGLKPDEDHKYSFALAEFYFGKHRGRGQASKTDMLFYASFGKPSIDFICNHDAILRVNLAHGHYNTDYQKVTSELFPASIDRNRSFAGLEIKFRVPFAVSGRDTKIGNGQHVVSMLILDYSKAQLFSVHPEVDGGAQALGFYLSHYLQLLQNAGHHVLYSLPDFDDDRLQVSIDFSTQGQAHLELDEVYGVSVDKINAFLSASWLKSAMLVSGKKNADRTALSLAEYRSTWVLNDSPSHFHVKLGAPRIKAVCNQEVILLFSVDEVAFYDTTDFEVAPHMSYSNWEIAVLVNVVNVQDQDTNVTRIRLDLNNCRFVRPYCDFPKYDEKDETAKRFFTRLIEFFTTEYLDILESAQYHTIYHFDIRWPKCIDVAGPRFDDDDEPSDWPGVPGGPAIGVPTPGLTPWTDITQKMDMQGFDQIIAITQKGLNAYFRTVFSGAQSSKTDNTLATWSYDDYFSASFQPINVRLLSDNKAIIWIHLRDGFLKTLRNWSPWAESEKYKFEDWRLAFAVDLKFDEHEVLKTTSTSFTSTFQDSFAYKQHHTSSDRVLKHIYMDLENADFIHEFSTFDGLFHAQDRRAIDKVQAVVTYLQEFYFAQLINTGHHVLYTVPIWKPKVPSRPIHALTEAVVRVYSQTNIDRYSWGQVSPANEPVIVVLGMTNDRVLPSLSLKYFTNIVMRATRGISYGTVVLSKRVFLEERLRPLLSRINGVTTIVPLPFAIENGEWKLELTTWAENVTRRGSDSNWVLDTAAPGVLKYSWRHLDGWTYRHEGSDSITNGSYSVLCTTKNYMEIPTVFKSGTLDIKIRGEVSLQLGVEGYTKKWSARSSASWSTSIAAHSEVGGLHLSIVGSTAPVFEKSHAEGEVISSLYTDPQSLLKQHLPQTIDLKGVLSEFKSFEGIWGSVYPGTSAYTLAQPVFDCHGDILFELRPHAQLTASAPLPPTPRRVSGTTSRNVSGSGRPGLFNRPTLFQKVQQVAQGFIVNESANGTVYANGNGASYGNGNGVSYETVRTGSNGNGHIVSNGNGHIASNGYTSKTVSSHGGNNVSVEYNGAGVIEIDG